MKQLLQNIIELKEKHNAIGLKIEFESEYFNQIELNYLREIALEAKINFIIKLGGFSSIKDMEEAKKLNSDIIIAPMVESKYALDKFICSFDRVYEAKKNKPQTYVNIETKCALENILEIFNSNNISKIRGVVLGRGDLAHSFDINNANDNKIFKIATAIKEKISTFGKKLIIGGQITPISIPFLEKINPNGTETRKILFNGIPTKEGIRLAILFERNVLCLKKEKTPYDIERIKELELRLSLDTIQERQRV